MKFRFLSDMKEFFHLNTRLVVAVIVGAMGLIGLQFMVHSSLSECIGIADSKETFISFEFPVTLKSIHVLPGQTVKKGQPLLEVDVPEIKLKLLEVQTELQALESEQSVRNSLLSTFSGGRGNIVDSSPLAQEIAGFRSQIAQLKAQLSQAVRYAESDGVVASVAYRPGEQVQQFMPIITLTSFEPTMVYGFVNENINFEVKIGDEVMVTPVSDATRVSTGRVVSVGSRIVPFPERLQVFSPGQTLGVYYGRELVVSLAKKNRITIGEKVHITGLGPNRISELGFQAYADDPGQQELKSEPLASGLPLEASALLEIDSANILAASDELAANGSPFWLLTGENFATPVPVALQGVKKIDDVESLAFDGTHYYAMGSLGLNKKGESKKARNLLIRFTLQDSGGGKVAVVDRELELRELLIEALTKMPMLQAVANQLQQVEVESLTVSGDDFVLALKQPQMPDGSTVVLRLAGLHQQVSKNVKITALNADIRTILRLDNQHCDSAARATDLIKTATGLLILANCKSSERQGQLWYLSDAESSHQARVLNQFRHGRPEGMALSSDMKSLYLASDNGEKKGADLIRVGMPKLN